MIYYNQLRHNEHNFHCITCPLFIYSKFILIYLCLAINLCDILAATCGKVPTAHMLVRHPRPNDTVT